ncbi:hypothetical protein [uncultured Roseobacter sp.]|uniref:hypothetical protein n=1 Tax=uncultured Roseobacter sp. TaxID=114847 RepID=UPI00260468B4|nr:hypothetical protein [uncultured Roseobacter sp.]
MAASDEPLYPAAQCAAFWFGYADYAQWSKFLDGQPDDVELAQAFRAVALRLGDQTEVDRFIAQQRPLMALLMEATIYAQDRQSREVFETLSETCEDYGAAQPELQELR